MVRCIDCLEHDDPLDEYPERPWKCILSGEEIDPHQERECDDFNPREEGEVSESEEMLRELKARFMIEFPQEDWDKMQEDAKILAEHILNYFTSDLAECAIMISKVRGGFTDEEIKIFERINKDLEEMREFYSKPCSNRKTVDGLYRCELKDELCRSDKCPIEVKEEEEEVK